VPPLNTSTRKSSALKLSIIVPAYNEEQNLAKTIEELQQELQVAKIPYEIIMINDNSRDGTPEVIRGLMERDPCLRTVDRTPPGGFGRAIRSGLDAVQGDVVVICMADSSDHPSDVIAYYRKICEGCDCVYGSRFIKGSKVVEYPMFKLIVNRIVNKCMQWMFRCPFNDLTNAFKAYRTHVIRESGPFRSCHFNITIEIALSVLVRRYNIAQIPISWTGRTWGQSNLRLREMGRRYLATLLRVYAEKLLVSDDLLADRLAMHDAADDRLASIEDQCASLRKRLEALE